MRNILLKIFFFAIIVIFIVLFIVFIENINVFKGDIYTNMENNIDMSDIGLIINNQDLSDYKNMIKIFSTNMEEIEFYILPVKISNKNISTITPIEFFDKYDHLYDGLNITVPTDEKIFVCFNDKIQVNDLYNIEYNYINMDFFTTEKGIQFNSIGRGIYVVDIEISNGDILKVIFR